jgi:hypothetical protein
MCSLTLPLLLPSLALLLLLLRWPLEEEGALPAGLRRQQLEALLSPPQQRLQARLQRHLGLRLRLPLSLPLQLALPPRPLRLCCQWALAPCRQAPRSSQAQGGCRLPSCWVQCPWCPSPWLWLPAQASEVSALQLLQALPL